MSFENVKKVGSGVLKEGLKNIKQVGLSGEYLEAAITGAAIGAAAKGTTEWAQGGSFTSGAASGAMTGAVMGAGYRGIKIGATGHAWESSGIKDVARGYGGMVSKQVTAINKNKANSNIVRQVMGQKALGTSSRGGQLSLGGGQRQLALPGPIALGGSQGAIPMPGGLGPVPMGGTIPMSGTVGLPKRTRAQKAGPQWRGKR